MAVVHIPAILLSVTHGVQEHAVPGNTVRELIDHLDLSYPGIKDRLVDGNRIRAGLSVFIDGLVRREGLDSVISPDSEVHFIPAVAGGLSR